ncbi:MAG: tetratricopeptide repeat protein [Promethearchaeota archaeon]
MSVKFWFEGSPVRGIAFKGEKISLPLSYYNRALATSEDLNYVVGKIIFMMNITSMHKTLEEYKKCIEWNNKALELARKYNYKTYYANVLNNILMMHYHQGNYIKAKEYTTKALRIFEEMGLQRDIDFVKSNLGDAPSKLHG